MVMMVSEASWKMLHPASVLVNLVPRAWQTLRSAWPLLIALFYGYGNGTHGAIDLGILLIFFFMTCWGTLVHFLTLRYRVEGGQLQIKSGLINRKLRVIDANRVQNIERKQNIFHRLSGLVEVRIETASGLQVEGLLSALDEAQAGTLIEELGAARDRRPAMDNVPTPLFSNNILDLVAFGATNTSWGWAILAIGFFSEASQWIQPDQFDAHMNTTTAGLSTVVILFGVWCASIMLSVLMHYQFRLFRLNESLKTEEGFFAKRRVELPIDKVQCVTVSRPLLRRLAGFGSLLIETAASSVDSRGTRRAEAKVPMIRHSDTETLLTKVLNGFSWSTATDNLSPADPATLKIGMVSVILRAAILTVISAALWWPWGLFALLILPVSSALLFLDYRAQGWQLIDGKLVSRAGWYKQRTVILSLNKLQSTTLIQPLLAQCFGVGRVVVSVAGTKVALPFVEIEEAASLHDSLNPGVL